MIKEEQWTDVGKHASRWGGEDAQTTCQTNPKAKPSRIDGAVANKAALAWIESFKVTKEDDITTHGILELKLKRKAAREEKTYAIPLTSLKKLFQTKVRELVGEKKGKEAAEVWKEQRVLLHKRIDAKLENVDTEIRIHRQQQDTTKLWETWSKAVEQGWLEYLDEGKVSDEKCTGRGEAKLVTTDPTNTRTQPKKGGGPRGGAHNLAFKAIRQARRCEQLAARIQMINNERKDQQKRQVQYTLNVDAIRNIRHHKGDQEWEQEGINKLKATNKAAEDITLVPGIKRLAAKYHEEARKQREIADKEIERCNKKRYEAKGEGQWAICRDMGSSNANPLVAATRPKRGPQGQPKGSVATSPRK